MVSGFLGSGKTTLVRHLLEAAQASGTRIAVVSNELGELGIDRALLGSGGEAFVELEGGCVCCELSDDLVDTLQRLRDEVNPDRIVIETSGVALPFDTTLNFWRDPIAAWVGDDTAIVVVNAEQLAEGRDLEGTFEDQVSSADLLVVTKVDLVDNRDEFLAQAQDVAYGVPVICVSAMSGVGIAEVREQVGHGQTVALVGSSCVGKSTLTNLLLGEKVMYVQPQRSDDDRGRHTTTTRELFCMEGGGCIVDTPGLRAVALWSADEGLGAAFGDIEALAAGCRFNDCVHNQEPGCAVREGVDEDRLASYHKLQRELAHVERKSNRVEANNTKQKWKAITKEMRRRNRDI